MVAVHVAFRYQGIDWTRDFHVQDGSSVRELKEAMVHPNGGSKEDVDSFELRQRGHRVFEFDFIWEETFFDFMYLGPEEGGKRSARDLAAKESFDRAAREEEERRIREDEARRVREEADHRRREEEAAREAQRAEKERRQAEERAAREAGSRGPKQVDIVVRHAVEDMKSQITVKVQSNSTVLDVRLAVMAVLGESKLSEIKLIKRQGTAFMTLSNETTIGAQREFLSMGRSLHLAVAQEGGQEAYFRVTSIQDYVERFFALPPQKTVKDLKVKICEESLRGPASQIQLWLGEREVSDQEQLGSVCEWSGGSLVLSGMVLGPAYPVQVQLTHATSGRGVSVTTLDTASIRELREATVSCHGGSLADIRIVKRLAGGHWQSLPDSEHLNGRTAFHCMGSALERPPKAAQHDEEVEAGEEEVELTISVCLDATLGFSHDLPVKRGSSIYALKELLAETDPTHKTKPEDFGLCLPTAPEMPLPEDTRLTEAHLQLNLMVGLAAQESGHPGPGRSVAGRWTMRNVQNGDTTSFFFHQEPGAVSFLGWQDGTTEISNGQILGERVTWSMGPVELEARLSEDGCNLCDVIVKHTESGTVLGHFHGTFEGPS